MLSVLKSPSKSFVLFVVVFFIIVNRQSTEGYQAVFCAVIQFIVQHCLANSNLKIAWKIMNVNSNFYWKAVPVEKTLRLEVAQEVNFRTCWNKKIE